MSLDQETFMGYENVAADMRRAGRVILVATLLALGLPATGLGHDRGVTGTLVEVHEDRLDDTKGSVSFSLRTSGGVRRLADAQRRSLLGQQVHVDDDDPAAGLQGPVRALGEQRVVAAVGPGPRTLLVILLTTADVPTTTATVNRASAAVFTGASSANALYTQQSAGATRFVGRRLADEGDVAGPLAIAVSTAGCPFYALADAADAAARTAGWAVDAYDHVLYALPAGSGCSWGGLGELPGRRLWSVGDPDSRIVAHELGHNLGAHHANAYRCTNGGGPAVTLSASCTSQDYEDPFDVMGSFMRLMSSWHRAQIGELPAGQTLGVRESQTVTLSSSDDIASAGTRLLLIPRKDPRVPVSSWLAVERRSSLGPFDLWAVNDAVQRGVTVRLVGPLTLAAESQLLDASPATASFSDAALQVGQTMTDAAHGISIRLVSTAGTTATVALTMPTLTDDVPPSAPPGVRVSGDTNAVAVQWTAATDDEAVDHYEVQRDGVTVGSTPGLRFDDTRVADVTTATYTVTAVDTSANRTASPPVVATLRDMTPPSAVPGLSAAVSAGEVRLTWSAAQDNRGVARYRILRNGALRATVTGLGYAERPAAGLYVYGVSAVDSAGIIGRVSNVDDVVIAPPAQPPPVPPPPPAPLGPGPPPPAAPGPVPPPPATVPPAPDAALLTLPLPASEPGVVFTPLFSRAAKPPVIGLVSRSRRGRIVTMRFSAPGATAISAYRGSRRVGRTSAARLTLRLTLAPSAKRPRVKVIATSTAGASSRTYALTRPRPSNAAG
ncbi:MAG TPA: hypothetical protein VGO80_10310 [Solirubrobacteraceae bacterium]|jgi:hypothetical protein|nr:hypothetical protein [Solirubrobacteraceae bacterium]